MSSSEQMEGETRYQASPRVPPGREARAMQEKAQTAPFVFSKPTWRSLGRIMISLVYSCGRVADLTPFLAYE